MGRSAPILMSRAAGLQIGRHTLRNLCNGHDRPRVFGCFDGWLILLRSTRFLDVLAAGAACGSFWEFCAFWSLADFAASKYRHGDNLALLAFGAVSLRLLDLGVPYGGRIAAIFP